MCYQQDVNLNQGGEGDWGNLYFKSVYHAPVQKHGNAYFQK